MADNLQVALDARAVIEQAKGIMHAKLGVPTEDAFELIRRFSQNTNQKARRIAERLVAGELDPRQLRGPGS